MTALAPLLQAFFADRLPRRGVHRDHRSSRPALARIRRRPVWQVDPPERIDERREVRRPPEAGGAVFGLAKTGDTMMAISSLRYGAVLFALLAPAAAFAAIGEFTGTSSPTVVTPPSLAPAPQTPAYPPPRMGEDLYGAPTGRWVAPNRPPRTR